MIFEKYSGSGNDFLITHICTQKNYAKLAQKLCNRNLGIGADGLIILKPHPKYAYQWLFFNSDGSQAKMCGNASRCVGYYAFKHSLAPRKHTFLATDKPIEIEIKDSKKVRSNLGNFSAIECLDIQTSYDTKAFKIDTGVPHIVIFTKNQEMLPKQKTLELKTLREQHNANINIAYIKNDDLIYVNTYERGVEDITLACGTGMAAASIVAHTIFKTSKNPKCIPPSNEVLSFFIKDEEISFEGNVVFIATCII